MIKSITDVRFRQIVASYGTVPARWPEEERDAAIAASQCPEHAALLREASELDEYLTAHEVRLPGAAAIHRIAATAPGPRRTPHLSVSWLRAATFVGTGLAGIMLGALALPVVIAGGPSVESDNYAMTYDISISQVLS